MGGELSRRQIVFLFPGQSSKYGDMIASCVAASASASQVLDHASAILGRDLAAELSAANPDFLATNRSVQLAVFIATQMHLAQLSEAGIRADFSAGLSLGEYSHLVDIGALDFAAALRLVDARGAAYDAGPEGMMVSLFPVSEEAVRAVIARIGPLGCVEISNFNSPQQFVISGERNAVIRAATEIEESEFASAIVIEDKIAMHSSVFRPVAESLRPHLESADWQPPAKPYIPNVMGRPSTDPTPQRFVEYLCRHVHEPVLWRQSIESIAAFCPQAVFVEVGPGRVLSNLMKKSWISLQRLATDDHGPTAVADAIAGFRQHEGE